MRIRTTFLAIAGAALALAPAATAHITLNPKQAAAGSWSELLVRVPNERDSANTIKVDLKLPDGFLFASYAPVPGWKVQVVKRKLAAPMQTEDGPVSEVVSEVIWSGDGVTGKIAPGQFMDFPLSVQVPGNAGDTLVFPALQTYDSGEIVRWIGGPDADEPAPRVAVTAAAEPGTGMAGQPAAPAAAPASHDGLTIGLAAGGLALAAGALALNAFRRKQFA
jgi:uncharacterized protein